MVGLALNWLEPRSIFPIDNPAAGLPFLAAGALLAMWGKRELQRAGTTAHPALPATALVETGPFRFSRNPLYLARMLLYVGLALAMNTAWPLATLVPLGLVLHYGVICREERYLGAKFGDSYREYQARVRRWL